MSDLIIIYKTTKIIEANHTGMPKDKRRHMIEIYKIMHELYDNKSAPNILKWEDV